MSLEPDEKAPNPERQRTDESLRAEREKADDPGGEALEGDVASDAVISRARARADKVLAEARRRADRAARTSDAPSPSVVGERGREDQTVRAERAEADESLRAERVGRAELFAREREETDEDLSRERARADTALATRDDFLGIVSHDLRNMLNSVIGFAALLETEERHDLRVEYTQRIQAAGARMDRLVGDLLDVASIEAGSLAVTREVGDLTEVVTEAIESVQARASSRGISLVAEPVPRVLVAFDAARVLQVLINLLGNALKFTPHGGTIVLRAERIDGELRVSVRDTGHGIPADKLEAIFGRGEQVAKNDRRGVGLGLHISKSIVQGHGGRIWATSTVGEGSTFFFTLPLEPESPPRLRGEAS